MSETTTRPTNSEDRTVTASMFDLFSKAEYQAARTDGLITVREDGAGLFIHNYSDAAMFTEGAWTNPAVRGCRGLITTEDDEIVARPWAKFFNHGQAEAGELDMEAPVEVTDKMDGSLGIIHRALDGRLRVATRGSFQSDQAEHATAILRERYASWLDGLTEVTPLVEIIYPGNRIVCDYGDTDDLVLLGGVHIETGDYLGPQETASAVDWPGPIVSTFPYATLKDALEAAPRDGAEGLCVRYLTEPRIVKIKQDDYVRLHRIVTGLSERTVWEHMTEGGPLGDLLAPLPDELHDWTRGVWQRLDTEAAALKRAALTAHAGIVAALPGEWTRADYAEQAKRHGSLTPWLFNLLDGRDPHDRILRTLKPAGDTRAKAYSEATA